MLVLTTGVAVATLLAVGAILIAPAIADCYGAEGGAALCLRDKLVRAEILPERVAAPSVEAPAAEPSSAEIPVAVPALPVAAAPSIEPVLSPEPPRASPGWLSANATEYEPPPPATVLLVPAPGSAAFGVAVGDGSVSPGRVALAGPQGTLDAHQNTTSGTPLSGSQLLAPSGTIVGGFDVPAQTPATVALAPSGGQIAVDVADPVAIPPTTLLTPSGALAISGEGEASGLAATVAGAVVAPTGQLTASIPANLAAQVAIPPATALTPSGALATSGEGEGSGLAATAAGDVVAPAGQLTAGIAPSDPAAPLSATLTYVPPPDLPTGAIGAGGVVGSTATSSGTASLEEPEPLPLPPLPKKRIAPPPAAAAPIIREDPRFPSVTVLPPPNTGFDSSFVTLD